MPEHELTDRYRRLFGDPASELDSGDVKADGVKGRGVLRGDCQTAPVLDADPISRDVGGKES